jgi:hypothetical protein
MLILLAGLFLLTGPGRSLGVDAWLGPWLDARAAQGSRLARFLSWLT